MNFVDLNYSHRLLNQIKYPNAFIWNTMMRAYLQSSSPQSTIFLCRSMLEKSFAPNNYTHPIVIQACSIQFSQLEGTPNCHVGGARQLFDKSFVLDAVSWNSILAGYIQIGDVEEATLIYNRMLDPNTVASNSMIVLLGRSGRVLDARSLFDKMLDTDVVSWSAIISCDEQNEMFREALAMFSQMNKCGIVMDEVVMVIILSACAHLLAMKEGKMIHGLIVRIGIESYVNLQNSLIHIYSSCGNMTASERLFNEGRHLDRISWNSMISRYLNCSFIDDARMLFDSMPEKDVVSWSAMISGYTQHD